MSGWKWKWISNPDQSEAQLTEVAALTVHFICLKASERQLLSRICLQPRNAPWWVTVFADEFWLNRRHASLVLHPAGSSTWFVIKQNQSLMIWTGYWADEVHSTEATSGSCAPLWSWHVNFCIQRVVLYFPPGRPTACGTQQSRDVWIYPAMPVWPARAVYCCFTHRKGRLSSYFLPCVVSFV